MYRVGYIDDEPTQFENYRIFWTKFMRSGSMCC